MQEHVSAWETASPTRTAVWHWWSPARGPVALHPGHREVGTPAALPV